MPTFVVHRAPKPGRRATRASLRLGLLDCLDCFGEGGGGGERAANPNLPHNDGGGARFGFEFIATLRRFGFRLRLRVSCRGGRWGFWFLGGAGVHSAQRAHPAGRLGPSWTYPRRLPVWEHPTSRLVSAARVMRFRLRCRRRALLMTLRCSTRRALRF